MELDSPSPSALIDLDERFSIDRLNSTSTDLSTTISYENHVPYQILSSTNDYALNTLAPVSINYMDQGQTTDTIGFLMSTDSTKRIRSEHVQISEGSLYEACLSQLKSDENYVPLDCVEKQQSQTDSPSISNNEPLKSIHDVPDRSLHEFVRVLSDEVSVSKSGRSTRPSSEMMADLDPHNQNRRSRSDDRSRHSNFVDA